LSDIKNVISAGLDLRYLYRNEILSALEDARVELWYQLDQQERHANADTMDLLELLRNAQRASAL
jgi:hypothetical protein